MDSLHDVKTMRRPLELLGVEHFDGPKSQNQRCPICQSGDHFSINQNRNDVWLWKCHNPKKQQDKEGGTVIDLYAEVRGVSDEEACRQLADEYLDDNVSVSLHERTMSDYDTPTLPRKTDAEIASPEFVWYDGQKKPGLYTGETVRYFKNATYLDVETVKYDGDPYGICIARWDHDEGKTVRPLHWTPEEKRWLPGFPDLDNYKRPLFNLKELQDNPDKHTLVVEGEKCMHATRRALDEAFFEHPELGEYLVTTNMGGSNAVNKTDWTPLRRRDVTILPDIDEGGEKFLKKILLQIGQQANVCWVEDRPHPMPESSGRDIADVLQEGQSIAEILEDTTTEEVPEEEPSHDIDSPPDRLKRKSDVYLSDVLYRIINRDKDVPAARDLGEMWEYNRDLGVWQEIPEVYIQKLIQKFDGKLYGNDPEDPNVLSLSDSKVNGIYNQLKLRPPMDFQDGFFDEERIGIAFQNGFVTTDGNHVKLMNHSPAHRARHGFDFEYDPDAKAPRFRDFLQEIFYNDDQRDQKIQLLQEFIGAGLFGFAVDRDKALFLHGTGEDGKSQLVKIIDGVMPERAIANVTPQKMADEKHRVNLINARFNLVSEMPAADVLESEAFKAIIAGDPISARDVYKSTVTFRPTAAHVFAANAPPKVNDVSHGFWRRWIKVNFNRKFVDDPDPDENEGKKELNLAERIIDEELEGVVAWMIEGAKRTYQRDAYDIPKCCENALEEWRTGANPLSAWMRDNTYEGREWTKANDLYLHYENWCNVRNHKPMAQTSFGSILGNEIGIEKKRKNDGMYYKLDLTQKMN